MHWHFWRVGFYTGSSSNSTVPCVFQRVEILLELSTQNLSSVDLIVRRANEINLFQGARDVQVLEVGVTHFAGRDTRNCEFVISGSTIQDGRCSCAPRQFVQTVNSQQTCAACTENYWCDGVQRYQCQHPSKWQATWPGARRLSASVRRERVLTAPSVLLVLVEFSTLACTLESKNARRKPHFQTSNGCMIETEDGLMALGVKVQNREGGRERDTHT